MNPNPRATPPEPSLFDGPAPAGVPEGQPAGDRAAGARAPESAGTSGDYWNYCANCGHRLVNDRCKLRCPACFYFLSCSDFD